MHTKIIPLFFYLFLSACASPNSPVALPTRNLPVQPGQSVSIHVNAGEVTVQGGENGQIRVEAQTLSPEQTDYSVTTVNDQVQVVAKYAGNRTSDPPIHLRVSVPDNTKLQIETESASITVREYSGNVEAASVSGDLLFVNVDGEITARSNRGDVRVQHSAGTMSVAGNYGLLTLEETRGDIGVSTIMGTITFSGAIGAGDEVRLETDHGPVAVHLAKESTLNLHVSSTSGDVACLLPGLSTSLRSCAGNFNSGEGTLKIRTVSGAVTVQVIP